MAAETFPEQQSELSDLELNSYRQALELARQLPFTLKLNLAQNILRIIDEEYAPRRKRSRHTGVAAPRKAAEPMSSADPIAAGDSAARRERLLGPDRKPLNPMYYIEQARERRGIGQSPTEAEMRQLIDDYQAETGRTLDDEELRWLLFEVKMQYEHHDDYEPPNPMAFLERVRTRPRTGLPPPTDEEIAQWIDEHRMKKYGNSRSS